MKQRFLANNAERLIYDRLSVLSGACIASWFERWHRRQRELADGADADLVKANRRRYRLAFALIGFAFLLAFFRGRLHLPAVLDTACRVVVVASFAIGFVLARWAMHEHEFLSRPDPEGPPEIFSNKRR